MKKLREFLDEEYKILVEPLEGGGLLYMTIAEAIDYLVAHIAALEGTESPEQ